MTKTKKPKATLAPKGPDLAALSNFAHLIADPSRLEILGLLSRSESGEMYVGELCEAMERSQPAISHHLALLKIGRVVDSRREGKRMYYAIDRDGAGTFLGGLGRVLGGLGRVLGAD